MKCKCGKTVTYPDHLAAKLALARLRKQDKPGHSEVRAYRCRYNKWHLTSR